MKKLIIICLCLSNIAIGQNWKPESSIISFKIKHSGGINASGSFSGFMGQVSFDPAKPEAAVFKCSIDAASINTANSIRDKELKSEEYFDVAKQPKIYMTAQKISKLADGSFEGQFLVTIKGVSKTISFPFSFKEKQDKAVFTGSFVLNRIDFGVGKKSLLLADKATVAITLNATKKQ
jgi:polyisoprenoid-binding protein YceI